MTAVSERHSLATVVSSAGGNHKFGRDNVMPPALADVARRRLVAVIIKRLLMVFPFLTEPIFQFTKLIRLVCKKNLNCSV